MSTLALPIVRVDPRKGLDKMILEVSPKDFYAVLRGTFALEVRNQIRLGNNPSNLLVDGSPNKVASQMLRRGQAFFTNSRSVEAAAQYVYDEVKGLTRILTGAARQSIGVFLFSGGSVRSLSSVREAAKKLNSSNDAIVIVGPSTMYGRKLWWNPLGVTRLRKVSVYRSKRVDVKKVTRQSIGYIVINRARRRFPDCSIFERWVKTTKLGDTPGIAVRFKGKGKTGLGVELNG